MCSSAVEIIPNLWLGNIKASRNRDFLHDYKINYIVNCTRNYDFDPSAMLPCTKKIRLPLSDTGTEEANHEMYVLLDKAVTYIQRQLINGDHILVHCYAGKQRSAAVIVAYLIKYAGLTVKEGMDVIYNKWQSRPDRYNNALTRFREVTL
jgi:hypothetical protein